MRRSHSRQQMPMDQFGLMQLHQERRERLATAQAYIAPLSRQEVEQVKVLPFSQTLQALTH